MRADQLTEQRDALRRRLEAIHKDLRRGLDDDLEEQSMQLQNYDVLLEIARVTQQQLDEIEARLATQPDDPPA